MSYHVFVSKIKVSNYYLKKSQTKSFSQIVMSLFSFLAVSLTQSARESEWNTSEIQGHFPKPFFRKGPPGYRDFWRSLGGRGRYIHPTNTQNRRSSFELTKTAQFTNTSKKQHGYYPRYILKKINIMITSNPLMNIKQCIAQLQIVSYHFPAINTNQLTSLYTQSRNVNKVSVTLEPYLKLCSF